jgi:glutamine amidotransferase
MKVGIVNYGVSNLASVRRALHDLGAQAFIADHAGALLGADKIVLPGVGSFSECMARLQTDGWVDALTKLVQQERKPLLGICLGMQMLAAFGEEGGLTPGLGFVAGTVRHLQQLGCALRVPHVGWNDIEVKVGEPLLARIPQGSDVYFVHSYAFDAERAEDVIATVRYGVPLVAGVRAGNVFGTQFHPEKSSKVGLQILQNFLGLGAC